MVKETRTTKGLLIHLTEENIPGRGTEAAGREKNQGQRVKEAEVEAETEVEVEAEVGAEAGKEALKNTEKTDTKGM